MSTHKNLSDDLKWIRKFVEYARYELNPGSRQLGDQFPRQGCADEAIKKLDDYLERLNEMDCQLCSIPDQLVQEWISKAREVARSKGLL